RHFADPHAVEQHRGAGPQAGHGAGEQHAIDRTFATAAGAVLHPIEKAEDAGDDRERESAGDDIAGPGFHHSFSACARSVPGSMMHAAASLPLDLSLDLPSALAAEYDRSQGCSDASIASIEPVAITRPSESAAMRSQTACRLSRSCVTMNTLSPKVRCSVRISSSNSAAPIRSRPDVGSSRKTISGSSARARANAPPFIMPPAKSG